jgi:hypothetical protein
MGFLGKRKKVEPLFLLFLVRGISDNPQGKVIEMEHGVSRSEVFLLF